MKRTQLLSPYGLGSPSAVKSVTALTAAPAHLATNHRRSVLAALPAWLMLTAFPLLRGGIALSDEAAVEQVRVAGEVNAATVELASQLEGALDASSLYQTYANVSATPDATPYILGAVAGAALCAATVGAVALTKTRRQQDDAAQDSERWQAGIAARSATFAASDDTDAFEALALSYAASMGYATFTKDEGSPQMASTAYAFDDLYDFEGSVEEPSVSGQPSSAFNTAEFVSGLHFDTEQPLPLDDDLPSFDTAEFVRGLHFAEEDMPQAAQARSVYDTASLLGVSGGDPSLTMSLISMLEPATIAAMALTQDNVESTPKQPSFEWPTFDALLDEPQEPPAQTAKHQKIHDPASISQNWSYRQPSQTFGKGATMDFSGLDNFDDFSVRGAITEDNDPLASDDAWQHVALTAMSKEASAAERKYGRLERLIARWDAADGVDTVPKPSRPSLASTIYEAPVIGPMSRRVTSSYRNRTATLDVPRIVRGSTGTTSSFGATGRSTYVPEVPEGDYVYVPLDGGMNLQQKSYGVPEIPEIEDAPAFASQPQPFTPWPDEGWAAITQVSANPKAEDSWSSGEASGAGETAEILGALMGTAPQHFAAHDTLYVIEGGASAQQQESPDDVRAAVGANYVPRHML